MKTIRRACLTALLLAISLPMLRPRTARLLAQQDTSRIAVTGVVGDAQSGLPIEGAVVAIPEIGLRTVSDRNGRFALSGIPPGEHNWLFRMLGYADWEEEMEVENLERLRVGLLPQPIALQNITATVDRLAERRKVVGVSVHALSWNDINSVVAASAADVITRRSPAPATSCATDASDTSQPAQQNEQLEPQKQQPAPKKQHPARSAPTVLRRPLGGASASVGMCVRWRGMIISPTIHLDEELTPTPLDVLHGYAPHEIHSIEYYNGGRHIRVYTIQFVESGKPLLSAGALFRR
jgi:hypothetical protein